MSKFKVKIQFEINQDELGTILGALTSSYRGVVETIDVVETNCKKELKEPKTVNLSSFMPEKKETKQFKEPAEPIYTTPKTTVRYAKKRRKKQYYDVLKLTEMQELLIKHARIGNANSSRGWLNFLNEKSGKNYNINAISGHIGRLMLMGILQRETYKESKYTQNFLYRIMRLPKPEEHSSSIGEAIKTNANGYYA